MMVVSQRKGTGPWLSAALLLCACLCGCATSRQAATAPGRHFTFSTDTFAFPNELLWVYHYDTNGNTWTESRVPKPDYTLHCFVVARSAVQFFENARFEPSQPKVDEAGYRRLVRKVVHSSLRKPLPPEQKVVIPGYDNLREFSRQHEHLLKAECGSAWTSYIQRGHWRMVFPFSRANQQSVASHLLETLAENRPAIVHVAKFPQLSINHALVVFACHETASNIVFQVYDPNEPSAPATLRYERGARTFFFPPNKYFRGGSVNIYRVYHAWNY